MSEFRKVCTKARKSPKCTYHVIIVSAIIEYFVNKDQRIAVKLFEFGLPKYKHEPAYVSAYIKFLWNLNDEKNTRVLFERVLSLLGADETRSDSAMTSEVWDLYLDFEHLCGNLGSISKLEKRRSTANNDYDPTGIFSLVSRYRYEDLWPCSAAELQSFGRPGGEEESATFTAAAIAALQSAKSRAGRGKHKSKGHAKGAAATAASSSAATATAASRPIDAREAAFSRFARPDIANHLIAYRPEMGLSLTPLGVPPPPKMPVLQSPLILLTPAATQVSPFPHIPDTLTTFLNMLPPPSAWVGPRVDIDRLITSILNARLPPQPASIPAVAAAATNTTTTNNAPGSGASTTAPSAAAAAASTTAPQTGKKRPHAADDDDDEDEHKAKKAKASANDVFRARQAAKLPKHF